MGRSVADADWLTYIEKRATGTERSAASKATGISYGAATQFDQGSPQSSGHHLFLEYCVDRNPWKTFAIHGRDELKREAEEISRRTALGLLGTRDGEAEAVLSNFQAFRRRYFGRVPIGYQTELGETLMAKYREGRETMERQFLLVNIAPGAGKTSTVSDWEARLIVENRRIRIGHFSVTSKLSVPLTRRLKGELERTAAYRPPADDIERGLAVEAESWLAKDYGLFKPTGQGNLWRQEEFIVVQTDGASGDKEPTCGSWGKDASFIGNRIDVAVCDDFIDAKATRTEKSLRDTEEVFDNEVETRLEPGGVLVLIGQRLHVEDIYAYARAKRIHLGDDGDTDVLDLDQAPRKYIHFQYPAHFEDRCKGHTKADPKPEAYPAGCLLEPKRLSWKTLATSRAQSTGRFQLVYQQDDTFSDDALVNRAWIDGGATGDEVHPGCWDAARRIWQAPDDPEGAVGVVTLDPSPTKLWGCIAWAYCPDGDPRRQPGESPGRRCLLDLRNERMEAPDILDLNVDQRIYYGLLEEWRKAFTSIGIPLQYVVVEVNAAQRFLFQYQFARNWASAHGITFITHTTTTMKLDPNLGLAVLKNPYRYGRYRLPGDGQSRRAVAPLVSQLSTRTASDDLLMSNWFLEVKLPAIVLRSAPRRPPTNNRAPSWLRGSGGTHRRRNPWASPASTS